MNWKHAIQELICRSKRKEDEYLKTLAIVDGDGVHATVRNPIIWIEEQETSPRRGAYKIFEMLPFQFTLNPPSHEHNIEYAQLAPRKSKRNTEENKRQNKQANAKHENQY